MNMKRTYESIIDNLISLGTVTALAAFTLACLNWAGLL